MNRLVCWLCALALAGLPPRVAAVPAADLQETWSDPAFQKQFLGSYGFQSEVEPTVTATERDQLEKILPLLSTDLDAAARQLEKIIRPESSAVLEFTLGNVWFQLDQLAPAAARFAAAIKKFPSFRRAHKNLGLVQIRQGQPAAAVQSLTRFLELGGNEALAYGLLGYAYAALEDPLAAESAYRWAALLQPDNLEWKTGLARSILKQQKCAEAASLLGALIQKEPERADLWVLQANAFLGMKEPLQAAQNYEILARLGKITADQLANLGDLYVNDGAYDLAAHSYLRALAVDPTQAATRGMRAAEILAGRGAAQPARVVLAKLRELNGPDLDQAARRRLLKLESRLAAAEGHNVEAAKVLEEIVSLDPLDGEALMLLGQHYARAGDQEKASFFYERAASLEAFEADAKVRHAQLLVGQSKLQEAIPLLRRAQEIKPRENVARYLDQVERIAKNRR